MYVSSTSRLALVRFPDRKEPITVNKPFLGFPAKPSPSFRKRAKKYKTLVHAKLKADQYLACITSSVGANPLLRSPPSPVGSRPLFWIGVGAGVLVSALYSWAASRLKMYAKQQALKTLAGKITNTDNYYNTLQKLFSIAENMISSNKFATTEIKDDSVCSAVDHVSPEETDSQKSAYEDAVVDVVDHISPSDHYEKGNSPRAVEALEKVLGNPAVQTLAMDVINKLFTAL